MLDLQPHEQEIDTPDDDIFEMVLGLGIFKLDMQAVFDTDIHLDRAVVLRRHAIGIDPEILLAHDIGHPSGHRHADEIPQLHIDAIVGFVLFLNVLEVKREGLRMLEFAGSCEFLDQGQEFVMISTIIEHLCQESKRGLFSSGIPSPYIIIECAIIRLLSYQSCR